MDDPPSSSTLSSSMRNPTVISRLPMDAPGVHRAVENRNWPAHHHVVVREGPRARWRPPPRQSSPNGRPKRPITRAEQPPRQSPRRGGAKHDPQVDVVHRPACPLSPGGVPDRRRLMVCRLRKQGPREFARPIAASAAATVRMKKTKHLTGGCRPGIGENAMKIEVDREQHQLDRHEQDDHVSSGSGRFRPC